MTRRALVTGASDRVGRAIAVELASVGFEVAVHYRNNADGAEQTAALCAEAGGGAWTVQADLADRAHCARLIEAVRERWDSLDVLVHNASGFVAEPFGALSDASWDAMQAVHVHAPFLLTRGLLDRLQASPGGPLSREGERGVVVGLVDIGADRPLAGYAAYSVSKAGLAMLLKSLAVELAPTIRTVGVSPGQVAWPPDYDEDKRQRLARRIPMGRVGTPEDVARLVRFLVLEAPYINGEIIAVDGGLSKRY